MRKANRKMYVELTEADREILKSFCSMAACLGANLGGAYEIVVHSFGKGDPFILSITNNSNSHYEVEDAIPDIIYAAIEQLQSRHSRGEPAIAESYSLRPDGKKCKFSSIGIVGSENRLIGMLNINFWLDVPLSQFMQSFSVPGYLETASLPLQISDSGRYNAALKQEILRVRDEVMDDPEIQAKYKRKEIVRRLNDAGIFKVKNAIQICADTLDITIATIYMHIRNQDSF